MKALLIGLFFIVAQSAFAQQVVVDVGLTPAGSFKAKTSDVHGFATRKGDEVSAQNIAVDLKNLQTGIGLRDKHTLKHLEADKYPQVVLVSAKGKGGQGTGVIRIKGIEKPIAGTYKISGNKLLAEFPLNLSDFGITGIKYMGIGVEDQAKIHVQVPIK